MASGGRLLTRVEQGVETFCDLHIRRHAQLSQVSASRNDDVARHAHHLARRTAVIPVLPPGWSHSTAAATLALKFGEVEHSESFPAERGRSNALFGARIRFSERSALVKCMRAAAHGGSSREVATVLSPPAGSTLKRGVQKYLQQYRAAFPGNEAVSHRANDWLVQWQQEEERGKRRGEGEADEDGFTVVKRSRSAHEAHVPKTQQKKRKREQSAAHVSDIYRFKLKERRRDEIAELQRQFQADRERLQKLREARKFKPTQ
jgi:ribosomal RNA-processing protein 7